MWFITSELNIRAIFTDHNGLAIKHKPPFFLNKVTFFFSYFQEIWKQNAFRTFRDRSFYSKYCGLMLLAGIWNSWGRINADYWCSIKWMKPAHSPTCSAFEQISKEHSFLKKSHKGGGRGTPKRYISVSWGRVLWPITFTNFISTSLLQDDHLCIELTLD